MASIRKRIGKLFPVYNFFFHRSYSQEGEDMVLRGFYEGRKGYKGFYVDVGALHPYRFSNTLYFYKKGWRGINIEPTPGAMKLFRLFRKRDINLNLGISEAKGKLKFYCFDDPALNSFSDEVSLDRANTTKYKIIKTIDVETLKLADALDKYLPEHTKIDFLTIDAEGLDLTVLQSNNWEKYRPEYILVEDFINLEKINDSSTYNFLSSLDYTLLAKTGRTSIFKSNR